MLNYVERDIKLMVQRQKLTITDQKYFPILSMWTLSPPAGCMFALACPKPQYLGLDIFLIDPNQKTLANIILTVPR